MIRKVLFLPLPTLVIYKRSADYIQEMRTFGHWEAPFAIPNPALAHGETARFLCRSLLNIHKNKTGGIAIAPYI